MFFVFDCVLRRIFFFLRVYKGTFGPAENAQWPTVRKGFSACQRWFLSTEYHQQSTLMSPNARQSLRGSISHNIKHTASFIPAGFIGEDTAQLLTARYPHKTKETARRCTAGRWDRGATCRYKFIATYFCPRKTLLLFIYIILSYFYPKNYQTKEDQNFAFC